MTIVKAKSEKIYEVGDTYQLGLLIHTILKVVENDDIVKITVSDEGAETVKTANKITEFQKIQDITIKHNGGEFNGNPNAQNNMTSVTAVANWQFNKNIEKAFKELALMNPSLEPLSNIFTAVYGGVYKSKIKWKTLQGKNSTRQIESIAEVLHKLMLNKGEIITGDKK